MTGQAIRYDRKGNDVEPVGITTTLLDDTVYITIASSNRTQYFKMSLNEWRTATWATERREYGQA